MITSWQPSLHRRSVHRSLNLPRGIGNQEAVSERVLGKAGSSSKIGKGAPFPPVFKHDVCFSVVGLIAPSRPATVFRAVAHVVVDPLKRHAVRSDAHISEEVVERVPPAVKQSNSSLGVVISSAAILLPASAHHVDPRAVGRTLHSLPVNGSRVPVRGNFVAAHAWIVNHNRRDGNLIG